MKADVIIVGAGPAGLMLAGELRLHDVQVVILERLSAPSGESRALGFQARTMEVFDQRGILPRFGEIETSPVGHFGGVPVDFGLLDGAHHGAKSIPQAQTEAVLEAWATELGADLRRGCTVVSLSQTPDMVTVELETPSGTESLTAPWLVGCDGGRSAIRKLAGFDFPGTESTMEMFLADVSGVDLQSRMIGQTYSRGMVMAGQLANGATRIIACERGAPPRKRSEPPPFSEIAGAWERITGQDISMATPHWVSAFGDASRQVTEYRRGRVFLVGDAAHIHLPAGGQGLNVSVQDAVNLGWKLATVARGHAPSGLLDSYHSERHPVGKRLLTNTRAQGLLFLSGDEVEPLREVMRELAAHDVVARHLGGMVSGLDVTYDVGPGSHPLLGKRTPHRVLQTATGTTSTTELLRNGRGLLLDLSRRPGGSVLTSSRGWHDRVNPVAASPMDDVEGPTAADPFAETPALLIRPDGAVAWAGDDEPGLRTALDRWFGPERAAA